MEENRFKENLLLYLFFIVSGVLLIISSFVLRGLDIDSIWVDVLLNVGASLISTAGIAYLYQQFGTNGFSHHLDLLLRNSSIAQHAMEFGIRDMWRERRHIPNDMWNTFTGSATSEVWLIGMAQLGFAEDPKFHEIVSVGTSRGCNYRFLLLDPDSEVAKEVDKREGGTGQLMGRIRLAIQKFDEMRMKNPKKKGRVELRIHANVPQVSIIRSDDDLLVTPYMFYRPGNSSFTFLVRKTSTSIYHHYDKFFNDVWENAYSPNINSDK